MDEPTAETTAEPDAGPFGGMDPEMAANPQPVFRALREDTPVMSIDGVGAVLSRKLEIDEAFRHPEIFSSNMSAVDLKNIRPLIPLQIDPPEHKKYRKLLDPIFAPREMAVLEDPGHPARQRPHRRLRRSRRGRLRQGVLDPVPVAGVPHAARAAPRRAAPASSS